MMDSLKIADPHSSCFSYDRQFFLEKWFVQSRPYMPTMGPLLAKETIMDRNFALINDGNCQLRESKLRRFNSHDVSFNMFSAADFENERLERRNEMEMMEGLQRRIYTTSNSIKNTSDKNKSSVGNVDRAEYRWSDNENKMPKRVNESHHKSFSHDINRIPMPSVVRISLKKKLPDQTLQSNSSNGSLTTSSTSTGSPKSYITRNDDSITIIDRDKATATGTGTAHSTSSSNISPTEPDTKQNYSCKATNFDSKDAERTFRNKEGELFLLYKFVNGRCIYHGCSSERVRASRKKDLLIPQEFPGYFSLINDKGQSTATQYTSLIQLFRERVFKFISIDFLPAFVDARLNEIHSSAHLHSTDRSRPKYIKTTAPAGEVYRLIAVFEDGNGLSGSPNHRGPSNGLENEKRRYAQLMNEGRKVFFVPLSTKGKFYEIETNTSIILQQTPVKKKNTAINPECVYRLPDLISPKKELPLSLRYVSGSKVGTRGIPEYLNITKITQENFFIACPINGDDDKPDSLYLEKIYTTREMDLLSSKFELVNDENMWSDPNIKSTLKFCQLNYAQFLQTVEIDSIQHSKHSNYRQKSHGLKLLRPFQFQKLLRKEKASIPVAEKEESIIFFTKSDLANLELKEKPISPQNITEPYTAGRENRISEKMKVFQPTKKKWFRKQDKDFVHFPLDVQVKRMSMERYTDMSKMLQERFGENVMQTYLRASEIENVPSKGVETSQLNSSIKALAHSISELAKPEQATNEKEDINEEAFSSEKTNALQKSVSLQNIPVQHSMANISRITDDILGSGQEDYNPVNPNSFITEKLYTEFHVKSQKHSKSSVSLPQMFNFARPRKMQLNGQKNVLEPHKNDSGATSDKSKGGEDVNAALTRKCLPEDLSACDKTGCSIRNTPDILTSTASFLVEDELPYSSVRDSLAYLSDFTIDSHLEPSKAINCDSSKLATKENIYAEICH